MKFEDRIKGMTAKEVVMSMVNGLRDPQTKINMDTFGKVESGICFGCAATNAVCNLMGFKTGDLPELLDGGFGKSNIGNKNFVRNFESAINYLRIGNLYGCNKLLEEIKLPPIKNPNNLKLPWLFSHFNEKQLKVYEQLANDQEL